MSSAAGSVARLGTLRSPGLRALLLHRSSREPGGRWRRCFAALRSHVACVVIFRRPTRARGPRCDPSGSRRGSSARRGLLPERASFRVPQGPGDELFGAPILVRVSGGGSSELPSEVPRLEVDLLTPERWWSVLDPLRRTVILLLRTRRSGSRRAAGSSSGSWESGVSLQSFDGAREGRPCGEGLVSSSSELPISPFPLRRALDGSPLHASRPSGPLRGMRWSRGARATSGEGGARSKHRSLFGDSGASDVSSQFPRLALPRACRLRRTLRGTVPVHRNPAGLATPRRTEGAGVHSGSELRA